MNSRLNHLHSIKLQRREWLAASVAAAASLVWSSKPTMADSKKTSQGLSTGLFRVRAVLELNGEIRLKSQTVDATNKNGKSIAAKTAPIKASSTVDFEEQYETSDKLTACKSYQHYTETASETQIDRHITKTVLRDQCRDVLRVGPDQGILTTCPDNPIFAAERDLIEGPINTMFLDQLLTDAEVNIADKWTIDTNVACRQTDTAMAAMATPL